jgi:sulfatase maturation enzyme AslB (radical SAM superfamily)
MNIKEYWFDKLNKCFDSNDRVELIKITDFPELIIAMVQNDVEADVILAGITNPHCPADIVELGKSRISSVHRLSDNVPLSTTFCPIPWVSTGIQQNGDLRICCQQIYHPFGKLTEDDKMLNVNNADLNESRNNIVFKELRKSMMNGEKHPSCNLCWKEEDTGLNSKRMHSIKMYGFKDFIENTSDDGSIDTQRFPIRYIDIRFGNLCNLKCRYCGPTDSSLWYEDFARMSFEGEIPDNIPMPFYGGKTYNIVKKHNNFTIDSLDFEWYESNKFWNQIEKLIPNIDRYYFTGGEPTINKIHFKLLQKIIDMGCSKNVNLDYNSNMFTIPDKLYNLWGEFKSVGIGCSIDAIGELAYYLRYPSTWDSLQSNLDVLGNNPSRSIYGTISTTVSVFNVYHFLDITKWLLEKDYKRIKKTPSYHVLEGPSPMSIQVLPLHIKEEIRSTYENFYKEIDQKYGVDWGNTFRNNYNGLLNYMFAKDNSHLLPKLAVETNKLDDIRGHKLTNYIPWLAKILEKVD